MSTYQDLSIIFTYVLFCFSQSLLQPGVEAGVKGLNGVLGEGEQVGAVLLGCASLASAEVEKLQPPVQRYYFDKHRPNSNSPLVRESCNPHRPGRTGLQLVEEDFSHSCTSGWIHILLVPEQHQ